MKPCVTLVLVDFELGLILDALDCYLDKLELEYNRCSRSDYRDVNILKEQLESLLKSDDVQVVER